MARFQHLRQRGGQPPFQVDDVLCASARRMVVQRGPGRVEFGRCLGPFGFEGKVEQEGALVRLQELENPALTRVGIGAVQIRHRDAAYVRMILADRRLGANATSQGDDRVDLSALGPAAPPEPATLLLGHLQERRDAVGLQLLVVDPILCAEATLLAADAAGLVYEEPRVEACVPVEGLGHLQPDPILENPALGRIGVAVGPAGGGLVRVIAILGLGHQ